MQFDGSSPTFQLPTLTLHREWLVRETDVDEITLTADLYMYAAVEVRVALERRQPDLVNRTGGILRHVFRDVPAGSREVVATQARHPDESLATPTDRCSGV